MDFLHAIIGSDNETIPWWQMVIRGVVIFLYALVLVRVAGRRAIAKYTSFDVILVIILGSAMSRALTANAQFLPTLAAATALVLLHIITSKGAIHSKLFGRFIRGPAVLLVHEGQLQPEGMNKHNISEADLKEAVRVKAGLIVSSDYVAHIWKAAATSA